MVDIFTALRWETFTPLPLQRQKQLYRLHHYRYWGQTFFLGYIVTVIDAGNNVSVTLLHVSEVERIVAIASLHSKRQNHTNKKENKIFFIYGIRKFRREIWLTASSFRVKYLRISSYTVLGSPSSYMTLHPIPSEFSYMWGKCCYPFYQCINHYTYKKNLKQFKIKIVIYYFLFL